MVGVGDQQHEGRHRAIQGGKHVVAHAALGIDQGRVRQAHLETREVAAEFGAGHEDPDGQRKGEADQGLAQHERQQLPGLDGPGHADRRRHERTEHENQADPGRRRRVRRAEQRRPQHDQAGPDEDDREDEDRREIHQRTSSGRRVTICLAKPDISRSIHGNVMAKVTKMAAARGMKASTLS